MNRQYIGARYVPIFSNINNGIWDNSYSYEPLTIVKHGNDFYTSRIPVPVDVDITNTIYWVKTGDYNGAIAEIENKIHIKTPEDYGAVGDGVTDDSSAFQSAVNDNSILLLINKYLIHDINIDHDMVITGYGSVIYTSPRDNSTPYKNVFTISDCNVEMYGVTIEGNKWTADHDHTRMNPAIDIDTSDKIIFKECKFTKLGFAYPDIEVTAIWNDLPCIIRAVDVSDFIFEENDITDIGGGENMIVTPKDKIYTNLNFNNNRLNGIAGASFSLYATDLNVNNNNINGYNYPTGSIFNLSAKNAQVSKNIFTNSNCASCFDGFEGGIFIFEHAVVSDNIYKDGTLGIFLLAESSDLKVTNNIVKGERFINWDLQALDPQYYPFAMPEALHNTALRTSANCLIEGNTFFGTSTASNNLIMRLGAILSNIEHPKYTKADIGWIDSIIIKNNNFHLTYRTTGGDLLGRLETGCRLFSFEANMVNNLCRDSFSDTDKFLIALVGGEAAKIGNLFNVSNNSFVNIQDGTQHLYILRSDYTTNPRYRTQLVNGNYISTGTIEAIPAVSESIIKYEIQS